MNMVIVHDIVLMFFYGCFCLIFAIVMAIPLDLVLRKIGYWLADRDFERRNNHYGKKR